MLAASFAIFAQLSCAPRSAKAERWAVSGRDRSLGVKFGRLLPELAGVDRRDQVWRQIARFAGDAGN
jgi:hypothetical protein